MMTINIFISARNDSKTPAQTPSSPSRKILPVLTKDIVIINGKLETKASNDDIAKIQHEVTALKQTLADGTRALGA
jgi:hypothetical protein